MTWVGLDLHQRYITACAMNEAGQVIAEHRRLPADDATVLGWLAAHPYQVKLIWQARCMTDPIDARKLADLLRTNWLPTVWGPDAEVRAQRKLLRGRAYLVRTRTRVKNRIHGYLMAENCRCQVPDLYSKAGRAWLRAVALPEISRLQVDLLLGIVDVLDERVRRLDQRIRKTVARDADAERLQTVPGIGPFGALLLLAEIGRIDRFASSHQLAAYAGLVPSTRSSGGKTSHGTVGSEGSPWLKWILIEIVQTLKLAPGAIGMPYQKLLRSTETAKAPVAAARKLCCYVYWMLQHRWSDEEWLQQHEGWGVRPEEQALVSVA